MRLALDEARRIILHAQGLDGRWLLQPGKEGVLQIIERLGYVQIDTIAVVERAHHHTLWSRCPGYQPTWLTELQGTDRRVFEYWTHAASYIPMDHYRYYVPRMREHAASSRSREWLEQHADVVQHVRERIRNEGPLSAAEFEAPDGWVRGTWWNWKPAKRALEVLFTIGELMVTERRGFQRVYDLAERVLPPGIDTSAPPPDELGRFGLQQALRAHGILALGETRGMLGGQKETAAALSGLLASGEVLQIDVDGLESNSKPLYALAETIETLAQPRPGDNRLHILSPFDNLIIWRRRMQRLFGFDYTLECYLPADKRQYGYFTLPMLWGHQFIGRLDAKAERADKRLVVRQIIPEGVWSEQDSPVPALAARLSAYAAFNACERIELSEDIPGSIRGQLWLALGSLPGTPE